MKKVLTLQLHRTPDGESVKDGGPALVIEIINSFKRKGYSVDSMSGNNMDKYKQGEGLSPFLQRIHKAKNFALDFDKKVFDEYDIIVFFHPSTLMGFEESDLPLEKIILFPTLLGREYQSFMEVPEEYIKLEEKILSYKYIIQSPSQSQSRLLITQYQVEANRIIIQPRGYSPSIFPSKERYLKENISLNNPLCLVSANAIRPQKGYIDLIDIVKFCIENILFIKIIIYSDIEKSTNSTYLNYIRDFIDKINKNGLNDYFDIRPAIDQKNLDNELLKYDFAIIPSIYESFGKTVIECSASGLPTMVFDDVPVYKEFLSDDNAIFLSRTPKDFYKILSDIVNDPEKYNLISKNGILNGGKYILEDLYDDLIDKIEDRLCIK
jgi:glycosyltransferase involved in cell wall biosynthesis